ncbi:MAG: acylphosphatase [Nitrososphaerales archaeon]
MANLKKNFETCVIKVEGVVQRVGFRRFVERAARSSKIAGYVENMRDGSVKIVAQGTVENVQRFVNDIKTAPKPIIVDSLRSEKLSRRTIIKNFQIKTGPLPVEIQEGFGAMESQFNDYREDFNNYRGEFKSFSERTDSNFKFMDAKYG